MLCTVKAEPLNCEHFGEIGEVSLLLSELSSQNSYYLWNFDIFVVAINRQLNFIISATLSLEIIGWNHLYQVPFVDIEE